VSCVGNSNNFALCSVTVLTDNCTNYRTDRVYWAEISGSEWHVYCLNTAYSLEIGYHYETNIEGKCFVISRNSTYPALLSQKLKAILLKQQRVL